MHKCLEEKEETPNINIVDIVASIDGSKHKIGFQAYRSVPANDKWKLIDYGIMVSTATNWNDSDVENNLRFAYVNKNTGEVELKPGITRYQGTSTSLTGGMTYNCNVGSNLDRFVYLRAYLIVAYNKTGSKDNFGEAFIMYTDAVKVSWTTADEKRYQVFKIPDIGKDYE